MCTRVERKKNTSLLSVLIRFIIPQGNFRSMISQYLSIYGASTSNTSDFIEYNNNRPLLTSRDRYSSLLLRYLVNTRINLRLVFVNLILNSEVSCSSLAKYM